MQCNAGWALEPCRDALLGNQHELLVISSCHFLHERLRFIKVQQNTTRNMRGPGFMLRDLGELRTPASFDRTSWQFYDS